MISLVTTHTEQQPIADQNKIQHTTELAESTIEQANQELHDLVVRTEQHPLLSKLDSRDIRFITGELKRSFAFAKGVIDYFDREQIPGEYHGSIMLCRGVCSKANDRLKTALSSLSSDVSLLAEPLRNYLEESAEYLKMFEGHNPFSKPETVAQINGVHHEKLYNLARRVLEFTGESCVA